MRPDLSQVHALITVFTLILCACNIGVELRSTMYNVISAMRSLNVPTVVPPVERRRHSQNARAIAPRHRSDTNEHTQLDSFDFRCPYLGTMEGFMSEHKPWSERSYGERL